MPLPRFDRIDFLLAKALIVLLTVATTALTLGVPLTRWLSGRRLTWELAGPDVTTVPATTTATSGTMLRGTDTLAVSIDHPGSGAWAISLLPAVVLSVAAIVIAWQLLRLLRRIEEHRAFATASAAALRVIGLTLVAASLLTSLLTGRADAVVARRASSGESDALGLELPIGALLTALLVLALAEAFAQGTRLQRDVEGLV